MGSFSLNGTFTAVLDPDFQPYGQPRRGTFIGGKPIYQGWESGIYKFPVLPSAAYNELRSRWQANSGALTSGSLPKLSGYGWQPISAWWLEPLPTGWDGTDAHGVTMPIEHIIRY